MKYLVLHDGQALEIEIREAGEQIFACTVGDQSLTVTARGAPSDALTLLIGSAVYDVAFENRRQAKWGVRLRGRSTQLQVLTPREAASYRAHKDEGPEGAWALTAPMPGKVTQVLVAVGAEVKAGQPLVVIEAMKMENELRAPADGVIAAVLVVPGATVESGATLIKT
jgi:biotin carboxyl carrier protein